MSISPAFKTAAFSFFAIFALTQVAMAASDSSWGIALTRTSHDELSTQFSPESLGARLSDSDEMSKAINVFAMQNFVKNEASLLHSVVNFFNYPGVGGTEIEWVYGTSPFKETALKLRAELRNIVKEADLILTQTSKSLSADDLDAVSVLAESRLYPLLRRMKDFVDDAYLFVMQLNEWSENSSTRSTVIDELERMDRRLIEHDVEQDSKLIQEGYLQVQRLIESCLYDRTDSHDDNDLNRVVFDAIINAPSSAYAPEEKPVFSKEGPIVAAHPEKIRFLLATLLVLLKNSVAAAHEDTLRQLFDNNRFFEILKKHPENFVEETLEGRLYSAIVFDRNKINIRVLNQGIVEISYETFPEIFAHIKRRLLQQNQSLSLAQGVAEDHHGSMDMDIDDERSAVTFKVALPAKEKGDGGSYHHAVTDWNILRMDIGSMDPSMQNVQLRRAVMEESVNKTYVIQTAGAAILSKDAIRHFAVAIEAADKLVVQFDKANHLQMSAYGSASAIQDEFDRGNQRVSLYFEDMESGPGITLEEKSYYFIFESYRWEEDGETRNKGLIQRLEREMGERFSLQMNMSTLLDAEMMGLILELGKKANFLQLPTTHDQEERLLEEEHHMDLMKAVLTDLVRVIDEVQEKNPHMRLSAGLVPIIAFRIAAAGSLEEIFELTISNDQKEVVATGRYEKKSQKFRYKHVDFKERTHVKSRVLKNIDRFEKGGVLSFPKLDRILSKDNIVLPEELTMSLLSAVKKEGGDDYFAAPSPESVLEDFLDKPDVGILVAGDRIVISRNDESEKDADFLPAWGFIVQMDGSRPEEVVNYDQAKKLYEDGYPWFQPNESFMTRYDNEGARLSILAPPSIWMAFLSSEGIDFERIQGQGKLTHALNGPASDKRPIPQIYWEIDLVLSKRPLLPRLQKQSV